MGFGMKGSVFYAALLLVFSSFAFGLAGPCGSYGDVDGDSYVTKNDSILAANYAMLVTTLTDFQKVRADVDGDGAVTVNDAIAIANYLTFPGFLYTT